MSLLNAAQYAFDVAGHDARPGATRRGESICALVVLFKEVVCANKKKTKKK